MSPTTLHSILNGSADFTLANSIGGAGSVTQAGTGTTILTGTNTYTGPTTLSAGTLQVGNGGTSGSLGTGSVTNNATLAFNRSDAVTVANTITGTGGLIQAGSGNLVLTGANTYSGTTLVNAGTLSVNGSIAGTTTVNNGGTLGGTGTVGSVHIASGGTLAPGNSIGTLTANGNLCFAPGSTYRVEANAAGAADRVNAVGAGTITIDGGTVDVQAGGAGYQRNTRYTILNADGGVTGSFSRRHHQSRLPHPDADLRRQRRAAEPAGQRCARLRQRGAHGQPGGRGQAPRQLRQRAQQRNGGRADPADRQLQRRAGAPDLRLAGGHGPRLGQPGGLGAGAQLLRQPGRAHGLQRRRPGQRR